MSVGFFEDVDSARLPPPTVHIVCRFPSIPNTSIIALLHFLCGYTIIQRTRIFLELRDNVNSRTTDSPEAERLYINQIEIVRVRVVRDEFCDDEPGPPKATEGVPIRVQGQARRLLYTVTVSPQISSRKANT
jgi:hypothetical protein